MKYSKRLTSKKLHIIKNIAENNDGQILKSVIVTELWKNKDFQTIFYINKVIEFCKENDFTVIDDYNEKLNDIIPELATLTRQAFENENTITYTDIVNKITSNHELNIEMMEAIFEYFEKLNINVITIEEENTKIEDVNLKDVNLEEIESLEETFLDMKDDEDIEKEEEHENDLPNVHYSDDSFKTYLNEIAAQGVSLLTAEEEVELALKIRNGDERAKQELVKRNLKLVISIAKHYIGLGMDLQDLIQEGNIGLLTACTKFNPDLGFRFSTYATHWIRQAITRALANSSRTIRLPVHAVEQAKVNNKVINKLSEELGRMPTFKEVADYINENKLCISSRYITPEIVQLYWTYYDSNCVISYNSPVGDEEDSCLIDFIEDNKDNVEDIAMKNDLKTIVRNLLDKVLSPKEADIIRRRMGIDYNYIQTLEQIGLVYGVTRERIRQIEEKAIRKLKRSPKVRKALVEYGNVNDHSFQYYV